MVAEGRGALALSEAVQQVGMRVLGFRVLGGRIDFRVLGFRVGFGVLGVRVRGGYLGSLEIVASHQLHRRV